MKLLHTGDWHLGDRLGSMDRTADLRRAVERVAAYCLERDVEVLVVAGDLFSERSRADSLRDSIAHLHQVFQPFLTRGGTILAITGNHDNETFCRTLCHAMALAAPESAQAGALVPPGRFYLATGPSFLRWRDRAGQEFQFVLMPYPTEHRYLDETAQKYTSLEEKHRALQSAYVQSLRQILQEPTFNPSLPAVLIAHVHVKGCLMPNLFRITPEKDIVVSPDDLPGRWAYVALGHIHRAQCIGGSNQIRYCGSIERLDLGERLDQKSVVLVELGATGLLGQPETLPLEATPFHDIVITNARQDLPRLQAEHADSQNALVRCLVSYQGGSDDLNAIYRELRTLFPRCYQIDLREAGDVPPLVTNGAASLPHQSLRDTVLGYLQTQLAEHPDRDAVLQLAEALLLEEGQ